jgi:hypothetical protein
MIAGESCSKPLVMKKQNKFGVMLVSVFILSQLTGITLRAQSVINIFDNNDNSVTLHFVGQEKIKKPDKILFVYDSNIITLESSGSYTNLYKSLTENLETGDNFGDLMDNFAMAEEIEQEIEIEAWMLRPFDRDYFKGCLIPEEECDMSIEPWMTDLDQWGNKK